MTLWNKDLWEFRHTYNNKMLFTKNLLSYF